MNEQATQWPYALLMLFSVFVSSISQYLLKKSATRPYDSILQEYLNLQAIGAYLIFLVSTILTVAAYRGVSVSVGPVLEATSYIYITFIGVRFFHEKMTRRKILSLLLILAGITLYTNGL